METESISSGCKCGVPGCSGAGDLYQIDLGMIAPASFSRDELQRIVDQAAGFGITAKPLGFANVVQAFVSGAVPEQRVAS